MRKFNKFNLMAVNFIKKDSEKSMNGPEWSLSEDQTTNVKTVSPEKCPSELSSMSTSSDICRICHCEGDEGENGLITPCYCSGSLRYVHQQCLQQWIKTSDIKCCELCKFQFVMETKLKPFSQWECLDMTPLEKRKLLSRITFNILVLTCATYSLLVLTDRATDELRQGLLEWPLWVKLLIVGIGAGGTGIYTYKEGRDYVYLFRRWRAYNRVIYIQNAPKNTIALQSDSPSKTAVHSGFIANREYPKTFAITLNVLSDPLLGGSVQETSVVVKTQETDPEEESTISKSCKSSLCKSDNEICDITSNNHDSHINIDDDHEFSWS